MAPTTGSDREMLMTEQGFQIDLTGHDVIQ